MQNKIFAQKVMVDGVSVALDYCLKTDDDEIILMGYFDRAKAKVKSIACSLGHKSMRIGYVRQNSRRGSEFKTAYKVINMGYDRFVYAFSSNKDIGTDYILTTDEWMQDDLFEHFMCNFKLPLLESWKAYLYTTLTKKGNLRVCNRYARCLSCCDDSRCVELHGKQVPIKSIRVLDVSQITNDVLTEIVSEGLKKKEIFISRNEMKPLSFDTFDSYITNYGASMVENLEKEIETLSPLKGKVDEVALMSKRLYPPQAACVNGMVALKESGSRYGLMIEGMGCGKTVQGASVVDGYFNKKWLKSHPGKGLKELYEAKEVAYRVVMMAPSHLVGKWESEVLKEIPDAKVTVLDDFSKLVALRERGSKRTGKEWYFISKDSAKLGSHYSPIPTTVGKKEIKISYCRDCLETRQMFVAKKMGNKARCPECGGRRFVKRNAYLGMHRGLLCPECGELLLKYSSKFGKGGLEGEEIVLTPTDFAARNSFNNSCYHCGAMLWGVDAKPIDNGQGKSLKHSRWHKISHWKNFSKKNKKTAFVLKGYEKEYMASVGMEDYTECEREYGPRKTAPELFIKKYLKGYFDMAILDECHKYENGGTAQSNAAYALMKAADFTLGLTGTICNGKADSFFYLLYMLDSRRMKKMGYDYGDVTKFAEKYGTLESVYENEGFRDGTYNSQSRGRMLQSPKVKPGISPLLFTDFLLDKSVFLDLSDLSKYIPTLTENVELVTLPDEVSAANHHTLEVLKQAIYDGEGRGILSEVLQFGLSYPDKPYGRKPIVSPSVEDVVIAKPMNFEEYSDKDLLLPKEQRLVDLVNREISEGRNCFVYCSYTGKGETNITYRLQELIESHCNLRGRVKIMQSSSPAPNKREEWIAKQAASGIKVFICNPKAVETGLDFCFWYDGKFFNYPTIIFYQLTYELAVMWQASRRHYRLNQVTDCRTFYLAYEGTLQAAAVEIMAEKQVAASAIQGKFSAEGLTAMAKGIDPRLKLAKMLSDNDTSDRKTLTNMFDALNASNKGDTDGYADSDDVALTYMEVMGYTQDAMIEAETVYAKDLFQMLDEQMSVMEKAIDVNTTMEETLPEKTEESRTLIQGSFFDMLSMFETNFGTETIVAVSSKKETVVKKATKKPSKRQNDLAEQLDLFQLLGA